MTCATGWGASSTGANPMGCCRILVWDQHGRRAAGRGPHSQGSTQTPSGRWRDLWRGHKRGRQAAGRGSLQARPPSQRLRRPSSPGGSALSTTFVGRWPSPGAVPGRAARAARRGGLLLPELSPAALAAGGPRWIRSDQSPAAWPQAAACSPLERRCQAAFAAAHAAASSRPRSGASRRGAGPLPPRAAPDSAPTACAGAGAARRRRLGTRYRCPCACPCPCPRPSHGSRAAPAPHGSGSCPAEAAGSPAPRALHRRGPWRAAGRRPASAPLRPRGPHRLHGSGSCPAEAAGGQTTRVLHPRGHWRAAGQRGPARRRPAPAPLSPRRPPRPPPAPAPCRPCRAPGLPARSLASARCRMACRERGRACGARTSGAALWSASRTAPRCPP
mmetsp:Transcript_1243/g.3789  ORF Transcript_1243/g.3789 Transcript_1243/m.3789 type:complete len:388 (+) Transcript_1243:562-1725(+)